MEVNFINKFAKNQPVIAGIIHSFTSINKTFVKKNFDSSQLLIKKHLSDEKPILQKENNLKVKIGMI